MRMLADVVDAGQKVNARLLAVGSNRKQFCNKNNLNEKISRRKTNSARTRNWDRANIA